MIYNDLRISFYKNLGELKTKKFKKRVQNCESDMALFKWNHRDSPFKGSVHLFENTYISLFIKSLPS